MGLIVTFRRMIDTRILELLRQKINYEERFQSHWDKCYNSMSGELKLQVSCPICCIDIETHKLRKGKY